MDINSLYKSIIENGFYDESCGMNPQIIDNKKHGVCIDFSQELSKNLLDNGYLAGIISNLTEDGFLHAAVIYRDIETGEIYIADPVSDIRELTKLTDEERSKQLLTFLSRDNWKRNPKDYLMEFGPITCYDENLRPYMKDIQDIEEIEAIPSINTEIEKKVECCQTVFGLSHIKDVADGPTLLACQTLYKKGIDTFCSNYTPGKDVSVNVDFTSLSDENKRIILQLMKELPSNYVTMRRTGFYGELGHTHSLDDEDLLGADYPLELVFGYNNSDTNNFSTPHINIEMNKLISMLKKQTYMSGVYSRNEVLQNKHNTLDVTQSSFSDVQPCKSNEKDSNEEIALNENLIYSQKYDMFFTDYQKKSRYIESLYRNEHDLRAENEIAKDANIVYEPSIGMFFEDEIDLQKYQSTIINPKEIAELSITRKPKKNVLQTIKDLFINLKNKIFDREDR